MLGKAKKIFSLAVEDKLFSLAKCCKKNGQESCFFSINRMYCDRSVFAANTTVMALAVSLSENMGYSTSLTRHLACLRRIVRER